MIYCFVVDRKHCKQEAERIHSSWTNAAVLASRRFSFHSPIKASCPKALHNSRMTAKLAVAVSILLELAQFWQHICMYIYIYIYIYAYVLIFMCLHVCVCIYILFYLYLDLIDAPSQLSPHFWKAIYTHIYVYICPCWNQLHLTTSEIAGWKAWVGSAFV